MSLLDNTNELSRFTKTYTTFSGADIVCTFSGVTIATLSGITYSITREKAPVYTMGSPNPRSFSRGKRGIAGTLIFTTFDRPALYEMLAQSTDNLNRSHIFTRTQNVLPGQGPANGNYRGITTVQQQLVGLRSIVPYYADQIPPFDISITFANEYGQTAVRNIYGVEIMNEGSGASMDDVMIEETMTYIARDVGPMVATSTQNGNGPGFDISTLNATVIDPS